MCFNVNPDTVAPNYLNNQQLIKPLDHDNHLGNHIYLLAFSKGTCQTLLS